MDISLVHQRISEAVNTAALKPGNLQVTATAFMPLFPTVPHFYPFHARIAYDKTFNGADYRGMTEITTTWHLVLSLSDDESGHSEAMKLMGSGEDTIRSVLLAARGGPGEDALDGACEDLRLTGADGPNLVDIGDTHLLVATFPISVIGR